MLLSALALAAVFNAEPPLIVNPPPPRGAEVLSAYGLGIEAQAKPVRPLFANPPRAGRVVTTNAFARKKAAPVFPSAPTWCRELGMQRARIADASVQASVTRLGDLPQANHTLTVLRKVDGCPVSSTVRFNVGR